MNNREFGPLNGNRGPSRGKHFLDAYGFNSQTPGSECFASHSFTEQNGNVDNTMVTDHGFRVLDDDPHVSSCQWWWMVQLTRLSMYGAGYRWPRQSWLVDPRPVNAAYRAYDQQPIIFQRGLSVDGNSSATDDTDSSPGVCHADLGSLQVGNDGQPALTEALGLHYDNLFFVDMDGNPIDGRKCSVIYEEDDPASQVHIVLDEDGNVVDMYTGVEDEDSWLATRHAGRDRPVTATADPVTITVKTGIDRPASSKPRPTMPAETTGTGARSGSVLTRGPFVY